jgi:carboxypeptidase family protein
LVEVFGLREVVVGLKRWFSILAVVLILVSPTVIAQTFVGGVRGLILDPNGAVVPGVNVTLQNEATGTLRNTISNGAGEYVFNQVEPATYTISAEASGFKKLDRKGVVIGTQRPTSGFPRGWHSSPPSHGRRTRTIPPVAATPTTSTGVNGAAGCVAQPAYPQNVYNLAAEWALAEGTQPLRYTAGWTYELPFGKGKPMLANNTVLDYLVGGWSVNGTAIIADGFPSGIFQTNANSLIGTLEQRPNATATSPTNSGGRNH